MSKIIKAKRAGGMAQVAEHLLRGFKPRVQTPQCQKKKKKLFLFLLSFWQCWGSNPWPCTQCSTNKLHRQPLVFWEGSLYVAEAGLELTILLPQLPVCWDYSYVPPNLGSFLCACIQITFFFWGGGTGVWTQGLALSKPELYCLSHASSPPIDYIFK
jgi:hypothetical protein